MNTKRITYNAIFIAIAIILAWLERIVPINFGIPGIKLGLSNIIIMVALYQLSYKNAFIIMLLKVSMMAFLFGNFVSFIYAFSGGLLSIIVMSLLIKYAMEYFSIISISVAGGVAHNIGQIISAVFLLKNSAVFYYLPILLIAGIGAGLFTGILYKYLNKYIKFDFYL